MRIDVAIDSPLTYHRVSKVLLNGVEVSHCVMADDERGEVACLVTDAHGRLMDDGTGYLKQDIRRGTVIITFKDAGDGG
jgi:uncharacterized protein (DUF39 family)